MAPELPVVTRTPGFDTLAVHAGQAADPATGALAVPIYLTSSFVFDDAEHARGLFDLSVVGHVYSRVSNPTTEAAEVRLAALEGGTACVLTSSGQAALTLALLALARAGDHVVASASLYGGTINLLTHTFADFGITVTLVEDPDDLAAWERAVTPETRAVLLESVGNPRGNIVDVAAVAEVAHRAGVPVVVDNTSLTPYLFRPLEHGADIVVYSATKFLSGHGTAIVGAIVDGGRFDFGADPPRWSRLTGPDPSYHGVSFWQTFSPDGIAYAAWVRSRLMRDLGPCPSPMNSFLLLQGLETLGLRMERQSSSAEAVARWLHEDPRVGSVSYPGHPSSVWFERARRLLPRGAGAVLALDLGTRERAAQVVDRLRLFSHLANIGDVRSLVIHPASTTHAQLDDRELAASGVTPGTVRLSIGVEAVSDLIHDLDHALG